jgi:hypothetical protein
MVGLDDMKRLKWEYFPSAPQRFEKFIAWPHAHIHRGSDGMWRVRYWIKGEPGETGESLGEFTTSDAAIQAAER